MLDARLAFRRILRTIVIPGIAAASMLIGAPARSHRPRGRTCRRHRCGGGRRELQRRGLDGGGAEFSATQLGSTRTIGGVPFTFGPANGMNAVRNRAITLPAGSYSKVGILAVAVNGNQPAQVFRVGHSDASSTSFSRSVSDWFTPQADAGERTAVAMTRRNNADGSADPRLDASKSAPTLTLPANGRVVLLAAALTSAAAPSPGTGSTPPDS